MGSRGRVRTRRPGQGTAAEVAAAVGNRNISPKSSRVLRQDSLKRLPKHCNSVQLKTIGPRSTGNVFSGRFLALLNDQKKEKDCAKRLPSSLSELRMSCFEQAGTAPADFVETQAKVYETEREEEVATLWWRAWGAVGRGEQVRPVDSNDPLTDALGSAAGRLAGAAFSRLMKYSPRVGDGLPPQVRPYFDAIEAEPNGHFARVMLARRLYHLYAIDPDWIDERLIPLFRPGHSDEAANLWYAYGSSQTIGPNLLQVLKEPFLEVLRGGEMDARTEHNLTSLFMAICLEAPNELIEAEKQSVADALSEEALKTVLTCLVGRLKGEPQERAEIWHDRIRPWIRDHWPTAAGRTTCGTSEAMLGLLAASGNAFPDAAVSSLEYLQPVQGGLFHLRESGHAARHPEEMLQVLEEVIARDVLAPHERGTLLQILEDMERANPEVQADPRFRTLLQIANL